MPLTNETSASPGVEESEGWWSWRIKILGAQLLQGKLIRLFFLLTNLFDLKYNFFIYINSVLVSNLSKIFNIHIFFFSAIVKFSSCFFLKTIFFYNSSSFEYYLLFYSRPILFFFYFLPVFKFLFHLLLFQFALLIAHRSSLINSFIFYG